ncbi:AraC family transcriptional regulator [Bradyrhizobium ontarionense]|uniref:AraC family transcriptional regulator n=1 Tax=Bradyrhizobium ontarionense TaxID=2898149 RepID=A0ABY3R4R0_9BRAD|nr:AraC family transcriptional regulator [Bradyrhizobium sp. A19]UFZ01811.1 AraC family transcriptional regulator [Bradyrhizobium sp. A19]
MDLTYCLESSELPISGTLGGRRWRDVLFPIFDVAEDDAAVPSDEFSVWATQRGALSMGQGGPPELLRIPRVISGRSFDQIALCLIRSGTLSLETQGHRRLCTAGSILVFSLRYPFRLAWQNSEAARSHVTLWLSQGRLNGIPDDRVHGRVLASSAAVAVFGAALQTVAEEVRRTGQQVLDDVIEGVAALSLNLLTADGKPMDAATSELASFVTIRNYIDAHLNAHDLSAATLARTFGLSRASLYRLFEPVGGVASYVRSRRLERVRETIKEPGLLNRRIAPVAYGNGFKSIASFNRAYRQAFGESPRQSRRGARQGPAEARSADPMGLLARGLMELR